MYQITYVLLVTLEDDILLWLVSILTFFEYYVLKLLDTFNIQAH